MAYTKGQLLVAETFDSNDDYRDGVFVHLPHSCNTWVIGGIAESEALIEDLRLAIEKLKAEKDRT